MQRLLINMSIVIVLIASTINSLSAQIQSWNYQQYTTKDGLPNNNVVSMTQDAEGFLWIATSGGLCRYDGDEFISLNHDSKDSTTIPTEYIYFVKAIPNNKVIVSTLKGLFVMNPKTRHGYTIHNQGKNEWAAANDRFGEIHIYNNLKIIVVVNNSSIMYFNFDMKLLYSIEYPFFGTSKPMSFTNHHVLFLPDGNIIFWSSTTERFEIADYKQKRIYALSSLKNNPYYLLSKIGIPITFTIDSRQNVWYLTKDSLSCFDPMQQAIYSYPLIGEAKKVNWMLPLMFVDTHTLVMGYTDNEKGILYTIAYDSLNKRTSYPITTKNKIGIYTSIYSLFTDKEGNKWLPSSKGLFLLRKEFKQLQKIDLPVPYHSENDWQNVTDIEAIDKDDLLITTRAEHCYLYNKSNNSITSFLDTVPRNRTLNYLMETIIPTSPNRYIIRGKNDLVFESNKLFTSFKPKNDFEKLLHHHTSQGNITDKNGNLWISVHDVGLVAYNASSNQYKVFPPAGMFVADEFSYSAMDKMGNLYFSSNYNNAIWKYETSTQLFHNITPTSLSDTKLDWIRALGVDVDLNVYIGTHQGVVVLNPTTEKFYELNRGDGLPSNVISGFFSYKNQMYISTENGLSIFNIKDKSIRQIRTSDGIIDGFTTNVFHFDTATNRFYIGGKGCVYKINPDSTWGIYSTPKVVIDWVKVNGVSIATDLSSYRFEHTQNSITISVSSIDYQSGNNKKYFYQYLYDGKKSEWKHNPSKQFNFLSLKPGNYEVHLRSKDANNNWVGNTAIFKFNILQPWYNRWWFYCILLVIIFSLIYLFYRIKIQQFKHVLNLRNKLSRDLHDDIGSTLSSINILSKSTLLQLADTKDSKVKESVAKVTERSQRLLDNMSDIVWNMNPDNDTLDDLISRIRSYASSMLEAKGINCDFDFPNEDLGIHLPMDKRNNIYLIFKEAVNNLVKYSKATQATISLKQEGKMLQLLINDNGVGFDEKYLPRKSGLNNIFHRTKEMKGNVTIVSAPNNGTQMSITITL